jgi:hypothetical protein
MHDPAMDEAYGDSLNIPKKALRYDTGKPRMDLLPARPLLEIGAVAEWGARVKYPERNIEQGIEWGSLYAPLQRHLLAWWAGEDVNEESGMSHLAHAGFWILFLMEYEQTHPNLDSRSKWSRKVSEKASTDSARKQTQFSQDMSVTGMDGSVPSAVDPLQSSR